MNVALGPESKKLTYSSHAERRMWQRNITEAEIREALSQPKDRHSFNRVHGTMNVRHTFPNMERSLIVPYEEQGTEVHIETVMDGN